MPEILAPAGNTECAEAAINSGATAVYLGYSSFSARAGAQNFDGESLRKIVEKAHFSGVRIYVAMNTLIKSAETENFLCTLLSVWNTGVDAIIMQDILLGKFIHRRYPDIVLHLSTQAGVCNLEGARIAKEYGFSRVILARETPLSEIKKIAEFIETEVFIQGALCTCFSGQCYFSSFAGGNSGNRGRCKQPCRKLYSYDREGFEERSYALSLSDLCVAEDVEKLREAGVTSFKIEGRMRRAEYVAAAVRYYRILLDERQGTDALAAKKKEALSDLKRTYNRGNYTRGLAFGQDSRFLSRDVQGHLGEKLGTIKVIDGKYFVETKFRPVSGDAFKVLRKGREVGGGNFGNASGRGFFLSSSQRLLNGDSIFITTDTAANARLLSEKKQIPISLKLSFCEGERATAKSGGIVVRSEKILTSAQSRPLTESEIRNCFLKTDSLPLKVTFEQIEIKGSVFLPKSRLNAFRRAFYERIFSAFTKNKNMQYAYDGNIQCVYESVSDFAQGGKNEKTAVIASDFSWLEDIDAAADNLDIPASKFDAATIRKPDIAIYKPNDYGAEPPRSFSEGKFEKFIYYPAFSDSADIRRIEELIAVSGAQGIYAENYGGIAFAKERGVALFAGTGFNLTNVLSVKELLEENGVKYYSVSKELDEREQAALSGAKAFVLSSGDVKLMDLCYCPFKKSCSSCDKRQIYHLTDESGRNFPVRRFKSVSGECRFEVYNCAKLVGSGVQGAGKIIDCSTGGNIFAAVKTADNEEQQKSLYGNYTAGHRKKSML